MIRISRGNRSGILIVGDSLPPNPKTTKNIKEVLDPIHPVYNSLLVPIKYYLNSYLNSQGFQLPLEKKSEDFFYYINAIDDPKTKNNPDLSKLKTEVGRADHKIILSMGSFAFWAVESVFGREAKRNLGIKELGQIFYDRLSKIEANRILNLPILHNSANRKFEEAKSFIAQEPENYISYFHYVGVQLGKLLIKNKESFKELLR